MDGTTGYMPEIKIKNIMPDGGMDGIPALLAAQGGGGFGGMGGLGGLLIGALLAGGFGGLGGWGRGMGGAGAAAIGSDLLLSPQFQSLQTQIGQLNDAIAVQGAARSADQTQGLIASTGANLSSELASIATAQANGNFTTLQSLNALGAAITAQNNQAALQELNSVNGLNTTILQSFNENSRDNANAFNSIQMSLANMAAQNAACCCDLKSAIAADGNATRALINDLHTADLQGQLNDAKLQISNTNQTLALEAFIASRLPVTSSSTVVV